LDGDGYGDDNGLVIACSPPDPSYVNEGFDCDDTDPLVFPYQGCPGTDCGFFYGVEWGDCSPGSYCDNGVCLPCEDLDGDGFTSCDGDCNDNDPNVYPGAIEGCNGLIDNNCDGSLGGPTGNEVYSPDWTAQSTDGQTVTLFGLLAQGRTVILDLFAAWCVPSQQMLTSNFLQDWNMHMGPSGTDQVRIVQAAVDQSAGSVTPFISAAQWPVIVQDAEDLALLYASIGMFDNAVPTLLMICPDRKVTRLFPQPDVLPYTGAFIYDPVAAASLVDAGCACNLIPCLTNIGCMDQSSCNYDPAANCPGPCVSAIEYFQDNDGDGFGSVSLGTFCSQPNNSAINGGDCDDNNPFIVPFSEEICGNGIDENCDGQVDEDCPCVPGTVEPCTGSDIGACDPGTRTCQFDGTWGFCEGEIGPISEFCDGIDNDCNGLVDDDPIDGLTWFRDVDGDGYGTNNETVTACTAPLGYVDNALDCDDSDPDINPGAPEACNTIDDDCDGQVDDGFDLATDTQNCGGCGIQCPPGFTCAAGQCVE
ncbi:MAG: hypothetical protein KDB96_16970, partial [Flavobacteriales bacterium]|nr:hypothetical protein [Flavobacteriales bacterium]